MPAGTDVGGLDIPTPCRRGRLQIKRADFTDSLNLLQQDLYHFYHAQRLRHVPRISLSSMPRVNLILRRMSSGGTIPCTQRKQTQDRFRGATKIPIQASQKKPARPSWTTNLLASQAPYPQTPKGSMMNARASASLDFWRRTNRAGCCTTYTTS